MGREIKPCQGIARKRQRKPLKKYSFFKGFFHFEISESGLKVKPESTILEAPTSACLGSSSPTRFSSHSQRGFTITHKPNDMVSKLAPGKSVRK
jgi:hypothetical protein